MKRVFLNFLKLVDGYLMGYDVFISYTWKDGRQYAEQLAYLLKQKHYRCFLDSSEYKVGDDLNRDAQRAVRWSRALAVVVTEKALCSQHVRSEIELFEGAKKQVVPIDVAETLYQIETGKNQEITYRISAVISRILKHSVDKDLKSIQASFELIGRDRKLQIEEPNIKCPSDSTIDLLCQRFDFTRKVSRRLRIIGVTCVVLFALTITSLLARNEAQKQWLRAEETLVEAIGVAKVITEKIDVKLAEVPGAETVRDDLLESSFKLLDSLLLKSPNNKVIEITRGDVAQNQGSWYFRHQALNLAKEKFEEALSDFENLPKDSERVIRVWLNLGRTNRDLRNFIKAKKFYLLVLESTKMMSDNAKAKEYKADAFYGLGHYCPVKQKRVSMESLSYLIIR